MAPSQLCRQDAVTGAYLTKNDIITSQFVRKVGEEGVVWAFIVLYLERKGNPFVSVERREHEREGAHHAEAFLPRMGQQRRPQLGTPAAWAMVQRCAC